LLVEELMIEKVVKIDSNKTVFDAYKEYCKKKIGSLILPD
jgi:predicted transcriptional regulator